MSSEEKRWDLGVQLDADIMLDWLDDWLVQLKEFPSSSASKSLEIQAQMFCVATFKAFILEGAAQAWKTRHETAFDLPIKETEEGQ